MTIRKKLLKNTLITITILFTLVFYMLGLFFYQTTKESKMEELQSLSVSKANEISLWFQEAINEFSLMASLPSFKTLDIREISPIIDSVTTSNVKLNNIGVSTIDGKSLLDNTDLKHIDHDTFNILTNSHQEYVIQTPTSSYPYFIICRPIYNYTNDKIGFIYGTIANSDILTILNQVRIPSSITWLIDNDFNIISHNKTYFYKQYLSYDKLANAIINDDVVLQTESNDTVFFAKNTIENTNGLMLCTLIPQSIILKDIYPLIFMLIILWISTITLLFFIINDTTNKIANPINELIKKMQQRQKNTIPQEFSELQLLSSQYNQLLVTIDDQIDQIYKSQTNLREAELKSLQAQINPHFLYNSLDTIKWMAYDHGITEIYDILASMSQFFRISLSSGKNVIPLEKEIEHVNSYLKIQQIRYEDILSYTINCQPEVMHLPFLKLIIQPLAENSLYHGIKPIQKPSRITINVFLNKSNDLMIQVKDNGIGIPEEKLALIQNNLSNHIKSDHYGLYNVNERLNHYYQDKYRMIISSKYGHGTSITIIIKSEAITKEREDV